MNKLPQVIVDRHLDRWIIDKKLGRGGQGTVFRLIDKETKSRYSVLKVLNYDRTKTRNRFHIERTALDTLEELNLNIPKVLSSNSEEHRSNEPLFLQTEFIDGKTLRAIVEQDGPLPIDSALSLMLDLLGLISLVHEHRIVHRDIKPSNIILNEKDELFLVDFGISFSDEHDVSVTLSSENLGSKFLSLPELRIYGEDKRDERTDITLCFGVLYYMLSGLNPIELMDSSGNKPHEREAFRRIIIQDESSIYGYIRALFDLSFEHNRHNRIQSANEAIEGLKKAQQMRGKRNLKKIASELDQMLSQKSGSIKKATVKRQYDPFLRKFFADACKKITSEINPFRMEMDRTILNEWPESNDYLRATLYHLSFQHMDERNHWYLARYLLGIEGETCVVSRNTGMRSMNQETRKFSELYNKKYEDVVKFTAMSEVPVNILEGDLYLVAENAMMDLRNRIISDG